MTGPDQTDVSTDEELSIQLHRLLIIEGHESVSIVHPIDGVKVVTQADYMKICEALKEVDGLTDAEKTARAEKIAKKNLQKLKKWMKNAEVRYVDISDDDSFGYDLAGDPIPMDGYAFTVVEQYPDGISFQEDEVGAFIDEYMQRKPIRIVHRSNYGLSDAMQQLADDCPPADHQALLDKLDEATP